MRSLLAVIASAVVLCGCAQQIGQLAATTARDNYKKCTADNKATPEGQMLAARLWQNDETDTAEKLSDQKPLTPAERNALVQSHSRALKCRQIIIEYDNQYAAWDAPNIQSFFQRSDQIFYKLASGEMPVGLANRLYIESNGQLQTEGAKRHADAVRADEVERQRKAEILLQAYAQRAAQSPPQIQQPQMPQPQVPQIHSTNCVWLGNTLNCTGT